MHSYTTPMQVIHSDTPDGVQTVWQEDLPDHLSITPDQTAMVSGGQDRTQLAAGLSPSAPARAGAAVYAD